MLKISRCNSRVINSVLSKDRTRIHYVCSLIEYTARKTHNPRYVIINRMSDEDIEHELSVALTNACLSFEQVSDELIEYLDLSDGSFVYDDDTGLVFDYLTVGRLLQACVIAYVEKSNLDLITAVRTVLANNLKDTLAFVE